MLTIKLHFNDTNPLTKL